MTTYYIDTSVLVAYYCPEPLSDRVQDFLCEQARPVISPLTEVELFSAVARKVRAGELNPSDGNRILARFSSHIEKNLFTVTAVEPHPWRVARGWIGLFHTPLRTLDALHLALASTGDLVLATSDRHLARAAEALGVAAHEMSTP